MKLVDTVIETLSKDPREGAHASIIPIDLKIIVRDKELPIKFCRANINHYDPSIQTTSLFCMLHATAEQGNGIPFIDARNEEFGERALLITDPGEFIIRIQKTIPRNELEFGPVQYYDQNTNHHDLTVFHKPSEFAYQREFRFWFKKPCEPHFEFKIGSIEDISKQIDSADLRKISIKV